MAIREEYFKGDGSNTIFQTVKKYVIDTIKVWRVLEEGLVETTDFQVLGDGYIMLNFTLLLNEEVKVSYTIEGTSVEDVKEDFDIRKRIVQLEQAVEALHLSNVALKEALNNRINVSTFQAWTRLIEKKTGITMIDKNLGYISQELFTDKS